MSEEISLSDLKGNIPPKPVSTEDLVAVNIQDIAPYKQEEVIGEEFKQELLSDLDKTIGRLKTEASERQDELMVQLLSEEVEYEVSNDDNNDDEDDLDEDKPKKKKASKDEDEFDDMFNNNDDFLNDLDDLDEEDDLTNDDIEDESDLVLRSEEDRLLSIKQALNDSIVHPIENKIDISSFTVSKKAISVPKLIVQTKTTERTADWVLPSTGKQFTIGQFSGSEIERLDARNSGSNRANAVKTIYNLIYSHIRDIDKPSFSVWLKQVDFKDITHLYFGAYKASFDNTNTIMYQCEEKKCQEMFLKEINEEEIIHYVTPEAKEKLEKILQEGTTISKDDEYDVVRYQISDEYVIDIKRPSIYNILFESASISESFIEKYSDLIGLMSYIDGIYYINVESQQLEPIESNIDHNSLGKTTMRKYKNYYDILSRLSSDQYYLLSQLVNQIDKTEEEVYYVTPEAKCPACGSVIPQRKTSGEQLLFTRHQLGALASYSPKSK